MSITDTEIPCTVTFGGMRADGKLHATYECAAPEPEIGLRSSGYCFYSVMLDLTPELLFLIATALMSSEACVDVTIRHTVPVGIKIESMANGYLMLDSTELHSEITDYLAELEHAA